MSDFVQVHGKQFSLRGKPYYFIGTNFWAGMNLASEGPGGDRPRLLRELDHLKTLGLTNLRIMAASEGPDTEPWRVVPSLQPSLGKYNEALLDGLDFLLAEMGKRDMKAVVCLNNFWPWSGGMAQYLNWMNGKSIPYPISGDQSWAKYQHFTTRFYTHKKAMAAYENHLRFILNCTNGYTNCRYADDPTIMSWQLANEPRGMFHAKAMRKWIKKSAALIKSIAPHQLVSVGSEGKTASLFSGTHFLKDHSIPGVDYATFHIWIQNWGWYDPMKPDSFAKGERKALEYFQRHILQAEMLHMPVVMEEFGIARDLNSHDHQAETSVRDRYYQSMFEEVFREASHGGAMAGCNFWAWCGEGRPTNAGGIWQPGDDLIGDPPHELQGWYSVYDQDESTLAVIRKAVGEMEGLGEEIST